MSLSIIARNSAPGWPPGVTAMALSFALTSGSWIALRRPASSLATIAGGVLIGAK